MNQGGFEETKTRERRTWSWAVPGVFHGEEERMSQSFTIHFSLVLLGGGGIHGRQPREDGPSQVLGVCLRQPSGERPRQESLI